MWHGVQENSPALSENKLFLPTCYVHNTFVWLRNRLFLNKIEIKQNGGKVKKKIWLHGTIEAEGKKYTSVHTG